MLCNLYGYFRNKEYNQEILQESFKKALEAMETTSKSAPITMVVTYHPNNPDYASAVNNI